MNLNKHFFKMNLLLSTLLLGLLFYGNLFMFVMSYLSIFVFATLRTLLTQGESKTKRILVLSYFVILIFQISMANSIIFTQQALDGKWHFFRQFFAVASLLMPVLVSRYIVAGKYAHFYLPSASEAATIGVAEIASGTEKIRRMSTTVGQTRQKVSKENLKAVKEELYRNDSFKYINNGSLNEAYFKEAENSLQDPHIYLVISRTGSPASEIISVFTQKQYNHASLSFDKDLQTTISYNGGEKIYPPGLNMEMIEFFSKSSDASILVYSLPCSREAKKKMLERIAVINQEGSAYNMLGLVMKRSYKPNIMFCSQFVYNLLKFAELTYFEKADGKVTPTDLVELDYYKKLKFEREIKF